jgi:hypothetical protein
MGGQGDRETGDLLKPSLASFFTVLGIVAMAALGGAAMVFSEFDDSPGGELIGLLLIVVATAIGLRTARLRV